MNNLDLSYRPSLDQKIKGNQAIPRRKPFSYTEQFLLLRVPDAWPASSSVFPLLVLGGAAHGAPLGEQYSSLPPGGRLYLLSSCSLPKTRSLLGARPDRCPAPSPTACLITSCFLSFEVFMISATIKKAKSMTKSRASSGL